MRKHKENADIEFASVYFNSTIKTIISFEYDPDKSFHEILFKIDNWLNEGSGWVIELTDAEYVNIYIYIPLSESSYIKFPHKLRNSMKGLINIKNNNIKCFLWCYIRHLNPLKIYPESIKNQIEKYG